MEAGRAMDAVVTGSRDQFRLSTRVSHSVSCSYWEQDEMIAAERRDR